MLLFHTTVASLALLVPLVHARTSISLCVTEPIFTTCYDSVMSTNCATLPDAAQHTTCACSTASAVFSCYTTACTSDKYYSSYAAALSICQAAGIGGPPGAGPTPTGGNAGAGATAGGTGTGTAAAATATGTGAGRNAAGPARSVGWAAGDVWVVMTGLGLWVGGFAVVLL